MGVPWGLLRLFGVTLLYFLQEITKSGTSFDPSVLFYDFGLKNLMFWYFAIKIQYPIVTVSIFEIEKPL